MRIRTLRIENLRAIELLELDDLTDFVLIAGPNGCGKTTIFDAIRLVKSIYVLDEWHRWYGEFGISVDNPTTFASLFRDPGKDAVISISVELSVSEAEFLTDHAENIGLGLVFNKSSQRRITITGEPFVSLRTIDNPQVEEERKSRVVAESLRAEIRHGSVFTAAVRIQSSPPSMTFQESRLAEAAFSCFNPGSLGEVEFHTSRRLYGRETINSVNLNVGDRVEERRSRFLYDLENKYRNIKSQLVEEYVGSILRREAPEKGPLQASIKELFRTFFPGKEFLGVSLGNNNQLVFPVRLSTGETHDIDELSSGEKEIVYGYLWLRTGTPRRSIVLVDEPELHLNPALVQGLVNFYRKNLAEALDAQVWIVTHSDAILRQGVRSSDTAVFHMSRPDGKGRQQALRLSSQDAVEAAVLDLIGDIAAYRPYAKIVLVEGHKETRFDVDMIRRLFPDLAERANFIAVGNRSMTRGVRIRLLEILQEAGLTGRAVSICDGDLGLRTSAPSFGEFEWPVYEIENFLLSPAILRSSLAVMLRNDPYGADKDVLEDLREIARRLTPQLSIAEVQFTLNGEVFGAIRIAGDPKKPAETLALSAAASVARVGELNLSEEKITRLIGEAHSRMFSVIETEDFLSRFPGDRLLREFAGIHGLSGEHFRNACLDSAQRAGVRPAKMESTLLASLA